MSRLEYAKAVLEGIGAPKTRQNERTLLAWMQAEGGYANWNPLNTTQHMPGSWRYNSADVQEYPSYAVGMAATLKTLNYGDYDLITARLRRSEHSLSVLRAVEASPWGTGGLAKHVLAYVKTAFHRYANIPVAS